MTHTTTVDEQDTGNGRDVAFRAFCETQGCTWAATHWHHADAQAGFDADDVDTFAEARDAARDAAEADATEHAAGADLT